MKAQILAKLAELQALAEQLPDEAPVPEPQPEPIPEPEPLPLSADEFLTGDWGYNQFRKVGLAPGYTIDASGATFIFDNNPATSGQQTVPILIEKSPGFVLKGGRVNGTVNLTGEWGATYVDGSGVRILECPGFILEDMRIDRTWDGIRFRINSNNFTLRRIHLSNTRDDMLENDYQHGGMVEDCLLDGGLCIMALDPPSSAPAGTNGRDNVIAFVNVLGRCQTYNQGGEMTHGSPFKCADNDTNPLTEHYDCVYAIMDPTHNGMSRHRKWAEKAKGFGSCYFLNLSDTKVSSTYAIPPGFTLIQGTAAREKWAAAKADWLAKHPGLA